MKKILFLLDSHLVAFLLMRGYPCTPPLSCRLTWGDTVFSTTSINTFYLVGPVLPQGDPVTPPDLLGSAPPPPHLLAWVPIMAVLMIILALEKLFTHWGLC